jgi:trimeric autotransporter adhesin
MLYSYNWVYAQGDVIAYYSDERLKTKVGSIENPLDKISKLNAFYYVENDLAKSFGYNNNEKQLGLSAQEVKEVLPEIVTLAPFDTKTDKNNNILGSKSGEDYLTVNYAKVVPLLVEGIKEQTEIIKSQQKQIDELKEMIKSLMK